MTQTLAPSPSLPLDHFSLSLLCLLGRSGIGEGALDHSVGLTTLVVPLLGSLAHLGRAVHLVIVSLATTLLGILFLELWTSVTRHLVTIKMYNSVLNHKSSVTNSHTR